jgi:hypothetical protein
MIYGILQKKINIINTVIGEETVEVDIMSDFIKELTMVHKFN